MSSPTAEMPKQEGATLPVAADPPVAAVLPVSAALPGAAKPAAELPIISDVEVISSSNNQPEEAITSVQINSYDDSVPVSDTRLPEGPVKPAGYSPMRPIRMFGGFMRDAWKMYKTYVFGYMPHMLTGK